MKIGLDSHVPVSVHAQTDAGDEGDLTTEREEADLLDEVGLTLANLPSATSDVVSVAPQGSFDEAITKMLLDDYSRERRRRAGAPLQGLKPTDGRVLGLMADPRDGDEPQEFFVISRRNGVSVAVGIDTTGDLDLGSVSRRAMVVIAVFSLDQTRG